MTVKYTISSTGQPKLRIVAKVFQKAKGLLPSSYLLPMYPMTIVMGYGQHKIASANSQFSNIGNTIS